jgi:hypothetical protein
MDTEHSRDNLENSGFENVAKKQALPTQLTVPAQLLHLPRTLHTSQKSGCNELYYVYWFALFEILLSQQLATAKSHCSSHSASASNARRLSSTKASAFKNAEYFKMLRLLYLSDLDVHKQVFTSAH